MKDIDAIVIGNMDHFEGINYVDCWSVDGSGGTMKPIIKLTTGGTTGCTVAIGGYHLVGSGMFDRVLIIGWEKNSESDTTGAITTAFDPIWDRLVFAGAISGPGGGGAGLYGPLWRIGPRRRPGERARQEARDEQPARAAFARRSVLKKCWLPQCFGRSDPSSGRMPPHRRRMRGHHGQVLN